MRSDPHTNDYLLFLSDTARDDVAGLQAAQKEYGNSWKLRGGVGAFMMLARKWDRIERRVAKTDGATQWDVFEHIMADERSEGLIDDIRDLRRYLLLVEAEAQAMGAEAAKTIHRDNQS